MAKKVIPEFTVYDRSDMCFLEGMKTQTSRYTNLGIFSRTETTTRIDTESEQFNK
jgi:hypothetical protein